MASRKETRHHHEFPVAPIRHMDVMDKLARCRFCDRLCCCVEHLLEHEGRHLTTKGRSQIIGKGRKCSLKQSGWVDATELALVSISKKINFPLFCIYCKITVGEEHELRRLMTIGPPCSLKESHWIISFKKYFEKTRNRKILIVLEETKRQQTDHTIYFNSTTLSREKKFQDINLTKLQSNSATPRIDHFAHPHVTPRDNSLYSLGKMKPISTSTPQDGSEPSSLEIDISSPAVEKTPIGAKTANAPQSILTVKNDQKPKGDSARKVTFSCIIETTGDSSIEDNCSDDNEGKKNEIDDNKNESGNKFGENEDYYSTEKDMNEGRVKNEKLIYANEECTSKCLRETVEQICDVDDRAEDENKINVVLEGNENTCKVICGNSDGSKEMELINEGEHEAVKEEFEEGKEQEETKSQLGNEGHGEVPKTSETNYDDRPKGKTIESSMKDEEKKSDSQHEENEAGNCSLDEESGGSSSHLTFYSGEESDNDADKLENEFFGFSDDNFKDLRVSNTGPKLRKPLHQTREDSQKLSVLSNKFSAGQELTKTSRLSLQDETNDNSENEQLLIMKELQIENMQASCKEDSEHSSSQDGDENNKTDADLLCSEENVFSDDSKQSNASNIEQEWGLKKIKSALSYSWGKAKELVMQPWGAKRNNLDNSEEENDENCAKRMKMSYSCSYSDPSSHSSSPVQWKCSQRPVRSAVYYNISKRRPLSRMMKK